ncbi:MAG: hypothetical protein H6599_00535 [Flavobacteriales bacterium]|nr:hypothetical protein [Flavobacteriales bacterium]
MNREELYQTLRLDFFDKHFPPPEYGNGVDVVELFGSHSWKCLKEAISALSDKNFADVMNCKISINFHNNVTNGHCSNGANWTMREFVNTNGGNDLRQRLEQLT